jgi:hypothetical protein
MVIYAPLTAQNESTSKFSFGAKVGFGSSGLALDYLQPLGQARTTFSVGGFAQYQIFSWLGVNADLKYAQAGGANVNPRLFYFKDNPMLGIPELNKTLERTDLIMHRIEVPITALITPPNFEGTIKPVLILGPSVGITVASKAINRYRWDFEAAPNDLVTVTQDDMKNRTQMLDLAGVFGLGLDIAAKPVSFSFGATYRMSFTNTNTYLYSLYGNYTINTAEVFFAVKF